jgi:hypothetical protein
VHQRACNCHALHLSTGKLVRHSLRKLRQTDIGKPLHGPRTSVVFACQQQGNLNVLNNAQGVQQLKRLENETDILAAQLCQSGFTQLICGNPIQPHMPGSGEIKSARQMKER